MILAKKKTATSIGVAETSIVAATESAAVATIVGETAAEGATIGTFAGPGLGTAIGAGIGIILGVGIIAYTNHEYIKEKTKETWHNIADTWHSWLN